MKQFIVLLAVVLVAHATSDQEQWQEFKLNHGKTYKSLLEEKRRFTIFQQNLRTIEEHNERFDNGESSYKMGVTAFADLTSEEFVETLKLQNGDVQAIQADNVFVSTEEAELPVSVDWRQKNVVSSVKNQGSCGACWAFSAVGTLESYVALKTGKLQDLSPQNLVDCTTSLGNLGCKGGLMSLAYDYIKDKGVLTESEYPYTGRNGNCHQDKTGLKIKSYTNISAHDEEAMKEVVATKGPVAVALDATPLQLYFFGILDGLFCGSTEKSLNHGVIVVGYGSEAKDFWLVKNSWGSSWGEHGYFRIKRGKNACGISLMSCYPTL